MRSTPRPVRSTRPSRLKASARAGFRGRGSTTIRFSSVTPSRKPPGLLIVTASSSQRAGPAPGPPIVAEEFVGPPPRDDGAAERRGLLPADQPRLSECAPHRPVDLAELGQVHHLAGEPRAPELLVARLLGRELAAHGGELPPAEVQLLLGSVNEVLEDT